MNFWKYKRKDCLYHAITNKVTAAVLQSDLTVTQIQQNKIWNKLSW